MKDSHIETIRVSTKNGKYDIVVGRGILDAAFEEILSTYKEHLS